MFTLAFMHIVVAFMHAIEGFTTFKDVPGTDVYLLETKRPIYLLKITLYIVQTFIGDSFVTYRLWVVWDSNKMLGIPLLISALGGLASGISALYFASRTTPDLPIFANDVRQTVVAFVAMTVFTNGVCTSLIALKIWMSERRISSFSTRSRNLFPIIRVVVESGAIYTCSLIALLVTYMKSNFSYNIVMDMLVQLIGIVFTLIIVRIGMGVASEQTTMKSRITHSDLSGSVSREQFQLRKAGKPVAVNIHTDTQVVEDGEFVADDNSSAFESGNSTKAEPFAPK